MVLSKDLVITMDNSANMKLLCKLRLISYVPLVKQWLTFNSSGNQKCNANNIVRYLLFVQVTLHLSQPLTHPFMRSFWWFCQPCKIIHPLNQHFMPDALCLCVRVLLTGVAACSGLAPAEWGEKSLLWVLELSASSIQLSGNTSLCWPTRLLSAPHTGEQLCRFVCVHEWLCVCVNSFYRNGFL